MPTEKPQIREVYAIDADKMKFRYTTKDRVGGNGFGLSDEGCMYTLNTIDQHMVAIVYGGKRKPKKEGSSSIRQGG